MTKEKGSSKLYETRARHHDNRDDCEFCKEKEESIYLNRYVIIWKGGIRQFIEGVTLTDALVSAGYDPDKIKGNYQWKFDRSAISASRDLMSKFDICLPTGAMVTLKGADVFDALLRAGYDLDKMKGKYTWEPSEDLDEFEISFPSGEDVTLKGTDAVDALLRAGYIAIEGLYTYKPVELPSISDPEKPKGHRLYAILWDTGVRQVIEGFTLQDAFSRIGKDVNKIKGTYKWRPSDTDSWRNLPDDSHQWLSSMSHPEKPEELQAYVIMWSGGARQVIEGATLKDAFSRIGRDINKMKGTYKWRLASHPEKPEALQTYVVTWHSGVTERIKGTSLKDALIRSGNELDLTEMKDFASVQTDVVDKETLKTPEGSSISNLVKGTLDFSYEGGSSEVQTFKCVLFGPVSKIEYTITYVSEMPSYTIVECEHSDMKLVIMGNQYYETIGYVQYTLCLIDGDYSDPIFKESDHPWINEMIPFLERMYKIKQIRYYRTDTLPVDPVIKEGAECYGS